MGFDETGQERCFLFLQGPLSSFYSEIASHLLDSGKRVVRVNFCGNDVVDWKHPNAVNYRGRPENWAHFLKALVVKEGVTDFILHGDRRFYHREAIKVAQETEVEVVATELGYLRPDWMTVERNACSTLSHFPNDPQQIREVASQCPLMVPGVKYPNQAWRQITQELRFTTSNFLMWPIFRHYRNHRPESRTQVYSGWIWARLTRKQRTRRSIAKIADLRKGGRPFFLAALQLESDFQIRDHSPFQNISDAIRYITCSFCENVTDGSLLVFKTHPLEYNQSLLERSIDEIAKDFSLGDRIVRIDAGDLGELSAKAKGFVTVNSSAGMESLSSGCPTFSILPTIYDVEGLTFQGDIDAFWSNGKEPDSELFETLQRALAGTIQVRGTLYNPDGLKAAAKAVAEKISTDTVSAKGAFVSRPPRLSKAARVGVTY